jgi:hypothetical protein
MERHPEDYVYSYYRAKQVMSELSGVVPIVHDVCINMCLAFTGPYDDHALLSIAEKIDGILKGSS